MQRLSSRYLDQDCPNHDTRLPVPSKLFSGNRSTTAGIHLTSLPLHSVIRDTCLKTLDDLHPQAFGIHDIVPATNGEAIHSERGVPHHHRATAGQIILLGRGLLHEPASARPQQHHLRTGYSPPRRLRISSGQTLPGITSAHGNVSDTGRKLPAPSYPPDSAPRYPR